MDRKKIENRLIDWSWEFGFILPDGSFPQSDLFSQLTATPHRAYLWDIILTKVQSKEKVKKIRKQILATSKLRPNEKISKTQDCLLNVYSTGVKQKIDLWKMKQMLEKKILEKKKEIINLHSASHKKAESVQSEVCRLAEIENNYEKLKEKIIISNLLLEKHRNATEDYRKQIEKIKSFGIVNCLEGTIVDDGIKDKVKNLHLLVTEGLGKNGFELEIEKKIHSQLSELIINKNVGTKIMDLLLKSVKDNLRNYLLLDGNNAENHSDECNEKTSNEISVKQMKEQFMLDITEKSLETVRNKTCEKTDELKLKEVIHEIEKFVFNGGADASIRDISYLKPNETGDSLTGQNEKMSKLLKALKFYGLKKHREFLRQEIETLAEKNKKNKHWTLEKEKYNKEMLLTSKRLESLKSEMEQVMEMQKTFAKSVLIKNNELGSTITEINYGFKDRNVFELMVNLNKEMRDEIEAQLELVENIFIDGFRKIHIAPGKEVFEVESLYHCLDHYGGELREFFCSLLVSPYDKPESILETLESRRTFASHINQILEREEKDCRTNEIPCFSGAAEGNGAKLLLKNCKEITCILSKILARKDNLSVEKDMIKKILRSWLDQPYRLMVPDSITVNSLTLRQYENER